MDLFMPAERVLYNRSYYFSDEAVDDYNEYIADRDGVNIDVVSSLDFFMNEVWKEIDYAIDNDLSDEISCFDRMLRAFPAASARISPSSMRTRMPTTSIRRPSAPSPTTAATRSPITAPTCISMGTWCSRGS